VSVYFYFTIPKTTHNRLTMVTAVFIWALIQKKGVQGFSRVLGLTYIKREGTVWCLLPC